MFCVNLNNFELDQLLRFCWHVLPKLRSYTLQNGCFMFVTYVILLKMKNGYRKQTRNVNVRRRNTMRSYRQYYSFKDNSKKQIIISYLNWVMPSQLKLFNSHVIPRNPATIKCHWSKSTFDSNNKRVNRHFSDTSLRNPQQVVWTILFLITI